MIETKEKNIEGATYMVTQLPARKALKMQARLIKMFGGALVEMMNTQDTSENLAKALGVLSRTLNENELETLIMDLLVGVRKNGIELSGPIIDLEFSGDMASLYQVVWFVIEVNFANFFSLIGIGKESVPMVAKPVQDTKTTYTSNLKRNY